MNYLISVSQSAAYALMVVVFWYIGKRVTDWTTRADDDEHIENKKNLAMALMRAGRYIGVAGGMAGALVYATGAWLPGIGWPSRPTTMSASRCG